MINTATLTGTVTDSSAAVVPNAKVTVKEINTAATSETIANTAGQWIVRSLPVGTYSVTVAATGFKTFVSSGVLLSVAAVARVDAVLQVGELTESVQVSGEAPRLETDSAQVGTNISNRQLVDLPLSIAGGRTAENFAYSISPGVVGDSWASHINGSTAYSKESTVDGATVTTYLAGGWSESANSVEALQEFKVQTSGMSAEYGRTEAGVFNYVMKSGTNSTHGSAMYSMHNEALEANTFAANAGGRARARDRENNYGFSFGAPVYLPKLYNGRDKTFFYATFERFTNNSAVMGSNTQTVPIPDFYQGDFSKLLGGPTGFKDALGNDVIKGAIYDPTTFYQLPNGQWAGQMFTGNQIPVSRFSKVANAYNAIAQKYYLPATGNSLLTFNNAQPTNRPVSFFQNQYSVKMDHIIGSHRISGSYSYTMRSRTDVASESDISVGNPGAGSDSGIWNASLPNGGPLSTAYEQPLKSQFARLSWDWTASASMVNHMGIYWNRMANPNDSVYKDTNGAALVGINGLSTAGYPAVVFMTNPTVNLNAWGLPRITYNAYTGWGALDTLSFSKGRHFLKVGYDFRRNTLSTRNGNFGGFFFSPLATAIPGAQFSGNLTGSSFASYLLGTVDHIFLQDPLYIGGRLTYNALFVQDDFKVNSKFTLNLGLRWEYTPPDTEPANRISSWSPDAVDPQTGLKGAYTFAGSCSACTGQNYFGQKAHTNLGPRIGFAYSPNKMWTVRGGYGIFYEALLFNNYAWPFFGKPNAVQATGSYNMSPNPNQRWAGVFNWDNGLPQNLYTPASYNAAYGDSNQPARIDPHYGKPGYIQQWNLNIQRQLMRNLILDVGYVGNKSTGLMNGDLQALNQLPASVLSRYGASLGNVISNASQAGANGIAYPYSGFSGTVGSALRPYPQVVSNDTVLVYGAPLGFSTYHSLQVTLNRQFSQGLSLYANYTWSKNLSNMQASFPGSNPAPTDYYNLGLQKAVTPYDVPHMFKAFADYQLPVGMNKRFPVRGVANTLLGGWTVQAILNYFSGTPLEFTANSPFPGVWNGGQNMANVAPGALTVSDFNKAGFDAANISNPADTYLIKSQFSQPAPLTLGTGAPYYAQARGFGTINEDLSLHKNFQIKEKYRVQVRGDFLDAFNRHHLGSIDTNVASPTFGQVTGVSGTRRIIQLGARLDF